MHRDLWMSNEMSCWDYIIDEIEITIIEIALQQVHK